MSYFETSADNIDEDEPKDYKQLYEAEHQLRKHYQRKTEISEIKLKRIMQSKNKVTLEKQLHQPKSQKTIIKQRKDFQLRVSDWVCPQFQHFTQKLDDQLPLVKNFAIYGIADTSIKDQLENNNNFFDGEILFTSESSTEIVMHSSQLAFPFGACLQTLNGHSARKKSMQVMSTNYSILKTFILSFQSAKGQPQSKKQIYKELKNDVLLRVNPELRTYAICLSVPEYTVIPTKTKITYTLQNIEAKNKIQPKPSQIMSCLDTQATQAIYSLDEDLWVGFSERVYCIFTHYPFFTFFEEFLKALLKIVKMQRLVLYRESEDIGRADSRFFLQKMKQVYCKTQQKLNKIGNLKLNSIYEIKLLNCNKLCLETTESMCQIRYSQSWIYPILKLFTLETFTNVLTLILLEQKVVFICENSHILTYTVYLFTSLLTKPFRYPYPIVTMIPDDEEYLNAPFPVVYGYLKSKQFLIDEDIQNEYKNVYVIMEKQKIEILSYKTKKAILAKKSEKLLAKLTPLFKKLHEKDSVRKQSKLLLCEEPFDFFPAAAKTQICMQITKQVNQYMYYDISKLLPTPTEIKHRKQELSKTIDQSQDVNHEVFSKIVEQCRKKCTDSFFMAFLHTQFVNVHMFQQY